MELEVKEVEPGVQRGGVIVKIHHQMGAVTLAEPQGNFCYVPLLKKNSLQYLEEHLVGKTCSLVKPITTQMNDFELERNPLAPSIW